MGCLPTSLPEGTYLRELRRLWGHPQSSFKVVPQWRKQDGSLTARWVEERGRSCKSRPTLKFLSWPWPSWVCRAGVVRGSSAATGQPATSACRSSLLIYADSLPLSTSFPTGHLGKQVSVRWCAVSQTCMNRRVSQRRAHQNSWLWIQPLLTLYHTGRPAWCVHVWLGTSQL